MVTVSLVWESVVGTGSSPKSDRLPFFYPHKEFDMDHLTERQQDHSFRYLADKKKKMEDTILNAMLEFEQDTGVLVAAVSITTVPVIPVRELSRVNVRVTLPI